MWWAVLATVAGAQVIDRLAAVVGGSTVVTDSDIALEQALAPLDATELPFWRHGDPTERLVDAALLRVAAADVALYQPPPEAVRARITALRQSFPTEGAWETWRRRWGLDDDALEVVLRRRLVVERYLQRNIATDPSDEAAWLQEVHRIVEALEARIQVRRIGDPP